MAKINQPQGPRTGNTGNTAKRSAFMKAKSETNSERSTLADFVMSALGMRGRGQAPAVNPALEGLDSNRGPKANPTANGAKLPGKYKSPKSKG